MNNKSGVRCGAPPAFLYCLFRVLGARDDVVLYAFLQVVEVIREAGDSHSEVRVLLRADLRVEQIFL